MWGGTGGDIDGNYNKETGNKAMKKLVNWFLKYL